MIKNRPCKIVEMSTSKTGKHGHAKVHMVALDIFTGKKLEDICPSTHNMDVPNVKRKDYQLIGMDDDFLSLMDDSGETRDDLKCPSDDSDVGKEVKNAIADETDILVTVLSACGGVCHRYKSQHCCRQIEWKRYLNYIGIFVAGFCNWDCQCIISRFPNGDNLKNK